MVLFLIVVAGCTSFIYKKPNSFYNHEKHVDILLKQNKDCFYCHNLPKTDNISLDDLRNLLKSGPEIKIDGKCHVCHRDTETKIAKAPSKCETCHIDMKNYKPADHMKDWIKQHSTNAKVNSEDCKTCHTDWYCRNCHSKQNTVEFKRHTGSFKLRHSIEAIIDPASCGSCHRTYFCIECHKKG